MAAEVSAETSEVGLTRRELEVVTGTAQGLRVIDIAGNLGVDASTVKSHIYTAKRKLGVNTAPGVAYVSVRRDLVPLTPDLHIAILWWWLADSLSWRQMAVQMCIQGLSVERISSRLNVSESTYKKILGRMYGVLGFSSPHCFKPLARVAAVAAWSEQIPALTPEARNMLGRIADLLRLDNRELVLRDFRPYIEQVMQRLDVTEDESMRLLAETGRRLTMSWHGRYGLPEPKSR